MPNNRLALAKFLWGAGLANTLTIGYRLDSVVSGSDCRDGSAWIQAPSGVEDAWITGTDYVISFELRWIPQVDLASPVYTGWDGTTGVRAWLEWMRAKNLGRFYPDATAGTFIDSYLTDPMKGLPTAEADGQRRLPITLRNSSTPYDGF
jgi:hypothetical protein